MADYRLYWITADDHIGRAITKGFESDGAALAAARQQVGRFSAIEVWQGARKVGLAAAEDEHNRNVGKPDGHGRLTNRSVIRATTGCE